MNHEDPLALDSSWSEARPNSGFHIIPLALLLYPTSQYTMPEHLAQCSPMPFGVANTNDGWGTAFHLQLLGPTHKQHGLARDAHKQGLSGRTEADSQIAAAFAGPRPDFDPKKLFPIPAQMPVEMSVRNMFLAPAPRNDNPVTHKDDTVAVDRSNPTPDDDPFLHSSVSPMVSSPSQRISPATPLFSDAVIRGENRCPDFNWDEYLTFNANPDPDYLNAMSMGFPELNCPIPDLDHDGDLVFFSPSPSPPRMQEAISSNITVGYPPYQNLYVDQINAVGPGCPSTHSPSPARILGERKRSSFHEGYPLATDTQPQAQHSPYRLGTASKSPHTRKDADREIKPTFLDALDREGLGFLADGASLPLPLDDMTFRDGGHMPLTETSPIQATGVPPTQAVHADGAMLQQTPDHPASLPVAESTNGDGHVRTSFKRPHVPSSDSDIYTCTYHGCTLRFETPRKLQNHKREAHRQMIAGRNRDASLPSLAGSQAGPHRCERVNPSTGKPCHSIFSRPYDLTRHEGTIHNACRGTIRCHLCSAGKTFTRNDALTRHMRVAHPEVPWAGKQRRKGRWWWDPLSKSYA